MDREEQKRELDKLIELTKANLSGAADFTGLDYSGITDDVIGRSARCVQLLFSKDDAWLKDPGATAGLIACYMRGAIEAARATQEGAS